MEKLDIAIVVSALIAVKSFLGYVVAADDKISERFFGVMVIAAIISFVLLIVRYMWR